MKNFFKNKNNKKNNLVCGFTPPPKQENSSLSFHFVFNLFSTIKTKRRSWVGGFTLIETLVSIFIFSLSVVALVSISASGVASASYVKEKFTANLLAVEGVEGVRALRDTSLRFGNQSWSSFESFMTTSCNVTDGCTIDTATLTPPNPVISPDCAQGGCPPLKISSDGLFTYGGVEDSIYTRTIKTYKPSGSSINNLVVESTVSWGHGNRDFSITYSEILSGWISPAQLQS